MQIHIEPDLAIPMPDKDLPFSDFHEKAIAACNSAEFLGLDTKPDEDDKKIAEQAAYDIAEEPVTANKKLLKKSTTFTPATYKQVRGVLDEFSIRVVDNATQIRLLVTNKLILESDNPDPKVRIRALELLGKITDVGLFTEKSEVTVTHRSSEELVSSLRAKIQKLMHTDEDAIDAEVIEINGETIDLDEELGTKEPWDV